MLENRWDCHNRIDALSLGDVYVAASSLPRKGWEIRDIPNPETVAQHEMDAAIFVVDFKEELIKIGANIDIIQDMLLVHDSGEPYMVLRDVTPHCKVSPEEKRRQEEDAIRDIFRDNAYAYALWIDMEEERTLNGRFGKEFDKLQAIKKARYYEDTYSIPGLTDEFYTYAVITKKQITTNFLLDYANQLNRS